MIMNSKKPINMNELVSFAAVAEHRGYSAAERALGIPKSTLSRHVRSVEQRVGVRLINRSLRKFQLTSAGHLLQQRCQAINTEMQAGLDALAAQQSSPRGKLRVGCTMLASRVFLERALPGFMISNPHIEPEIKISLGQLDLYEYPLDVAIRIEPRIKDNNYITKRLGQITEILVAAPEFVSKHGPFLHPVGLRGIPSMDLAKVEKRHLWRFRSPAGEILDHQHTPRVVCEDVGILRQAALAGCGIVRLPEVLCREQIEQGALIRVLPNWNLLRRNIYAVFLSRRGMSLVTRLFVDYISEWVTANHPL